MTEENKENINDINIIENIEQKPIEAFKDNIKKENISDIKIKNQSIQNNTNSYSKSFDSEKNDNKEKEFINNLNNINNINNKKESKIQLKKEELNELINNGINKFTNKNKKYDLIKKANKKPEIEPHSKYNLSNALKKIKNKSVEKKAKDLFNIDKKETNNEKEKNKFIKKLKEIEVKIEGITDLKIKKQKEENILEFNNIKNNKENKENNDINNNNAKDKDNFINFNFELKLQNGSSENKYQELKKLYFSCNKFDFTPLNRNFNKYKKNNNDKNSENKIKNNYKSYIELKNIYTKKCDQSKSIKKNQNMIRIINKSDNFKNILNKLENLEENKNENIFKNNLLLKKNKTLNDLNRNQNRNVNKKSSFDFFKSVSLEKSSKFKNIMDDVCSEIKDLNNYSTKRNFRSKISNIKSNIKYNTLFRREKNFNFDINKNSLINHCDYNKSNDLNFDDLLNLCSKRNLKFLTKNSNIIF